MAEVADHLCPFLIIHSKDEIPKDNKPIFRLVRQLKEENIEKLLKTRPDSKADLLAWKGGVALYRAAVALVD